MENKIRRFECLVDEMGLDDGGVASFTFEVIQLKKGKIYEEHQTWDGKKRVPSGYVIDDNSGWNEIGSESLKKKFKEI